MVTKPAQLASAEESPSLQKALLWPLINIGDRDRTLVNMIVEDCPDKL